MSNNFKKVNNLVQWIGNLNFTWLHFAALLNKEPTEYYICMSTSYDDKSRRNRTVIISAN